jgi:hypothetical protein
LRDQLLLPFWNFFTFFELSPLFVGSAPLPYRAGDLGLVMSGVHAQAAHF